METMKVYHLTIQENGHSRRFVYEDHDEALKRLASATTTLRFHPRGSGGS